MTAFPLRAEPIETDALSDAPVSGVQELERKYQGRSTAELMAGLINEEFAGRIALVSSFGTEAAVMLHMVASVDRSLPVIFLNTGKLFGETLRYRDTLIERLGLSDVRSVGPDRKRLEDLDPDGVLWYANPDMCCFIRKVEPLQHAIEGFDAWFTGRKRFHGGERSALPVIEATDQGPIKINPLAGWSRADVKSYMAENGLPDHPLEADGFLSVGCMPCTERAPADEGIRAGRWRGNGKSECGIHLPKARWRVMGID